MTVSFDRSAIAAIVLDIEGTTTPMAFVYEVLFPYARRRLRAFLREQQGTAALQDVIARLRLEWIEDERRGETPPTWPLNRGDQLDAAAVYAEWLMDRDRKAPALKLLQGYIWEGGYESSELHSELFPDVPPAIQRWRRSGLTVAIYSSGSVLAQRLLFGHTSNGDLTPEIDAFFDTGVGPKLSSASYQSIAQALGCAAHSIVFVSDATPELEAAAAAGCRGVLCERPGNMPVPLGARFDVIHSFDELRVNETGL